MIGVLLMSFGTAATLDDVPDYLASVRGGREAPEELVVEFKRRFARVGGSPLTRITIEQAVALESLLCSGEWGLGARGWGANDAIHDANPQPPTPNPQLGPQPPFVVRVGMRHAPPFIATGLGELKAAGAERVVAVILSPQYSDVIMGGYLRAVAAARTTLGSDMNVTVAGSWHDVDDFLDALASRVAATLRRTGRSTTPVLFTAHSLPRSVADGEPGYIQQLRDTAAAVAARAGIPSHQWTFAYQSAGHTREPWLAPDIKDVLPGLHAAGYTNVLVAPIQFLADHLEVLYDIDVAAREEAQAQGIDLVRTEMLNSDPGLIRALAAVVRRTLASRARGLATVT